MMATTEEKSSLDTLVVEKERERVLQVATCTSAHIHAVTVVKKCNVNTRKILKKNLLQKGKHVLSMKCG